MGAPQRTLHFCGDVRIPFADSAASTSVRSHMNPSANIDEVANLEEAQMGMPHVAYLVGSGACMGAADIVPGVSGGTMAIATGVYSSLLSAIASINVRSVKALLTFRFREAFSILHWRFLLFLGLGLLLGAGFMVFVVKLSTLIQTQPTYVYAVFFGLVLASAGVLSRRLPWRFTTGASLLVGVVFGWVVVNLTPVHTPESPGFLFLCGMIAISAMLLPGISGSFILLIMGKYAYVLQAVHDRDLMTLAPFALGCLVGIMVFSRVLKWLLVRFHDTVLAGLIGLLIGSLWRIWPYQDLLKETVGGKEKIVQATPFWPQEFSGAVFGLMIIGIVAVVGIELLAMRRRTSERLV